MRSIPLGSLVLLLGICLGLGEASPVVAACFDAGVVCKYNRNAAGNITTVDTSCVKLPTSLYIVNSGSPTTGDGWSGGTGLCGSNVNTRRPCGDYNLSQSVCGPGVPTGSPFPGNGDPCDPAGPDFNPWNCPGSGPYENTLPTSKALAVVQHLKDVAQNALPSHVEKAVEVLGSAASLHLRARVTLSSEATGDQPVPGIYEYWEKDGKYRMVFGVDVAEIPVSEIAYDGRQYQLALARASTLSVAYADERAVPSEMPNPLFLLLQPLNVATPDCLGCVPRLSDLRTLHAFRHAAIPGKTAVSPLESSGGFTTQVTLDRSGNVAALLQIQVKPRLVERSEFSDYRRLEGTGMDLPRSVKFLRTVAEEGSVVRVAIQYQIDVLELDRGIDDSVFTLDRSSYKTVWSDDRQQFLRAPHCPKSPTAQ
jgi:hypothetical protein